MHYKIVGVNEQYPDKPQVYRGEFQPREDEAWVLSALDAEFGIAGGPAQEQLHDWSGGEIGTWIADLAADQTTQGRRNTDSWQFPNDNTLFYVSTGLGPLE